MRDSRSEAGMSDRKKFDPAKGLIEAFQNQHERGKAEAATEIERLRDDKRALIDSNAYEVCELKARIEELERGRDIAFWLGYDDGFDECGADEPYRPEKAAKRYGYDAAEDEPLSVEVVNLKVRIEELEQRWDYIKADPEGARALLLLLHAGKGTANDFDTMVDRIIESRKAAGIGGGDE
jgi:hypothetical protein